MCLCEASFPKKMAFGYLDDLHSEFFDQYGRRVSTVTRPYTFIEFDNYIQKTKKTYVDSRARRNMGSINTELQDVQRIMVANIEEVLQRGEALSGKFSLVTISAPNNNKLNVYICYSSRYKGKQFIFISEKIPQ